MKIFNNIIQLLTKFNIKLIRFLTKIKVYIYEKEKHNYEKPKE